MLQSLSFFEVYTCVHMDEIGIRELRQQLAQQVRRANDGERIIITVDGRPTAQLGPIEPADANITLADLIARGLIIPPRRTDRPPTDFRLPLWAGARLDQILREVRGR